MDRDIHNDVTMRRLGLEVMALALEEQLKQPEILALPFDERLEILLSRQIAANDERKLERLIKQANLKVLAWPQDIRYSTERNLTQEVVKPILQHYWIEKRMNVLITGSAGTGKTWLACAFAVQAAMWGFSILYMRASDLYLQLELARGTGTLHKLYAKLRRKSLLIIDDFGLAPLTIMLRQDLQIIIDDSYGHRSLIITSQLPVNSWHDYIADPTFADAILDRLKFSSQKLELRGESQRAFSQSPGPRGTYDA